MTPRQKSISISITQIFYCSRSHSYFAIKKTALCCEKWFHSMLQSTLKWLPESPILACSRPPSPIYLPPGLPSPMPHIPTYPHVQKSFTHLGVKLEMRNGTLDRSRQEQASAAAQVSTINGSQNNRDGVLSNIDYTQMTHQTNDCTMCHPDSRREGLA